MHVERVEEQVRLVAHTLLQALELSPVQVVRQDGLVLGVRAFVDDHTGPLAGSETTDIGQTLYIVRLHTPKKEKGGKHACSVTITSRSCSVWSM